MRWSGYTLHSDNACVFFFLTTGFNKSSVLANWPSSLVSACEQVAPFLDDIGSYTVLGPALRKRKVDVDHIIASTKGMTVGGLMDQVNFKAGSLGGRSIAAPFRRRG